MNNDHDSPRMDPHLDALLRRVLGRHRLSDEQRSRHCGRLGIEPVDRAHHDRTMTALPFDIGRSQSVTFGGSERIHVPGVTANG